MKTVASSLQPVARIAALVILASAVCFAAPLNPVEWTLTSDALKAAPGSIVALRMTAKIDAGWHIYSVTTPPPTIPVQIKFGEAAAHVYQPKPEQKFDDALGA